MTARGNDYRVLQPRAGHRPQRQPRRGGLRRAGHGGRHGGDGQGRAETPRATRSTASIADLTHAADRRASSRRSARRPARASAAERHHPHRLRPDRLPAHRQRSDDPTHGSRPSLPRSRARPTSAILAAGAETQDPASASRYSDGFGREIQKKIQAEPGPRRSTAAPVVEPALGRQRLDHLQQQGQAGPPVRAVLQRHAPLRVRRAASASARCCSTTRSSASSPRCIPTTPGEGRLRSVAAGDLGRQRHRR